MGAVRAASQLEDHSTIDQAVEECRGQRWVAKIVGPCIYYVAAAIRIVFGMVVIEMIDGPSEVLILADRTGNPPDAGAPVLPIVPAIWPIAPSAQ